MKSIVSDNRRPLREVLWLDEDWVDVVATTTYPIAGVLGFGRGVFARAPIKGSETSYRRLNRLRAGQLVVSRLKAFEGAIAVVPDELEGYYVSPEFPTCSCTDSQLERGFLSYLCRWSTFWTLLAASSRGIGSRRERVHAHALLDIELYIPPVAEQRRIAARLDRVATSAEAADRLSTHASEVSTALVVSLASRPDLDPPTKVSRGWSRITLNDVLTPSRNQVRVDPAASYPNLGIYSFGRGVFAKPDIEGAVTSASTLFRVEAGQFIYSRLFAFEGAYANVPTQFDGYFVSNEFPVFHVDDSRVNVRWLSSYLRSPDRWAELGGSSKGIGVRRQRVPVDAVLAYEVWLPPVAEQHRIVAAIDKINKTEVERASAQQRTKTLVAATLNEIFSVNA